MADKNNGVAGSSDGNPVVGFALLCGLAVIGYLVFSAFVGSDRSEVRACIESAQRADVSGNLTMTFKIMLRRLDTAKEVMITRTLPNNVGLTDISFIMDGEPDRVICPA
jgi:hypothetical protein